MKARAPMLDAIDHRNFKDELKNSIVKRSRVRYFRTAEEAELDKKRQEEALLAASEAENKAAEMENGAAEAVEHTEDANLSEEEKMALAQAEEIFKRLQSEAEADEQALAQEWTERIAAENVDESDYNATTGSYSGAYGKGYVSEDTKSLADSILSEKGDAIAEIIRQQGGT